MTESHVGLKSISAGEYAFAAECPECGRSVHVPITLSAVLTVTSEGGKIRPQLSTKRVEHACGASETSPMLDNDGNVIPING